MRWHLPLLFVIVAWLGLFENDCVAQSQTEHGVEIDAVLTEIQKGLTQAQVEIQDAKLPPLESVTLTLQTEYVKKGGPKVKLYVITFGQTWEKDSSNTLTLVLKPPSAKAATESVSSTGGLSDQLVDAIVSAASGIQAAKGRKPPLVLDSMKAEFRFVVNSQTSGGVKFEIVPVSAELSGELSKKAVHTISVSFANPAGSAAATTKPNPRKK